jgi:uncharacterized protein with von Willebrand factor type A (vWA) domain
VSQSAPVDEFVRAELVRFVRALRGEASVPANAATTAARALAAVGVDDRERVRAALRASLLADSDDFEAFDRLFERFWRRLAAEFDERAAPATPDDDDPEGGVPSVAAGGAESEAVDPDDREAGGPAADSAASTGARRDAEGETSAALYSPSGSANAVDGARVVATGGLDPAFDELSRALAGLEGRRFRPGTDRADVRRALRTSVSTGGVVPSMPRRERRETAVRAALLVDVSRSVLDAVDRGFLVDFLRRARRDWRDARVFFFDEDLREVTGALDAPSTGRAVEALEDAETAWGGGTRIGGSLARLRETAPDAVDRRTVVFVVSDGLEMDEVSTLERELSWLARRGRRLLWLNPLAAAERYEPAARGMAAALPYVDGLFAFAGPADVAELARQLRRQGAGGRVGYEFDPTTRQTETTTTDRP